MKTVFISSTFKDMHFERDLVHERIAPHINEAAQQYGDHVSFCDLRWGVNTLDMDEEAGSRKVLNFCFDEIDRCRPYMVVFIGYRYGWIPDSGMLEEELRGRDLVLEDLERSVTELEIEYGALSRPENLSDILFYFRNIEGEPPADYQCEDEYHHKKLEQLKDRIRKLTSGRVREYSVRWDPEKECLKDTGDLSEILYQDLSGIFMQDWKAKENLSELDRIIQGQLDYAKQKEFPFSRRNDLIEEYLTSAKTNKVTAIKGESGSGKTAVMSGIIADLLSEGNDVCPIFCGTTLETNDAFDILSLSVRFLQNRLGLPEDTEAQNLEEMRNRLIGLGAQYSASADRELYFVIDALDQLFPDDMRDSMQFMIPVPGEHIHYIFTSLLSYDISAPAEIFEVPEMTGDARKQVVKGILRDAGRELDDTVIEAIIYRKSSDSPFYMGMLIMRLLMLRGSDFEAIRSLGDGMENISRYQRQIVEAFPDSLDDAILELIRAASERIGGRMAEKAVAYIAMSRNGLRQEELMSLLEKEGLTPNGLDFSMFVQYLRDFFLVRDDGRYDFTHVKIREGVRASLKEEQDAYLQNIFEVLNSLPDGDNIKTMELGHHAIKADQRETIYRLANGKISELGVMTALARDLREQSLEDDGEYLISLINGCVTREDGGAFIDFIAAVQHTVFTTSLHETLLKKNILETALHYISPKTLQGAALDTEVGSCCTIISGKDYLALGRDYYSRAIEFYEEYLAGNEEKNKDFVRRQYLYVLSLASENDVKDGQQQRAGELAYKGIGISEQSGYYNHIIRLYTNAVSSHYYVGISRVHSEERIVLGKKKYRQELEKAVRTAEKGDELIGNLYRDGILTEKGVMEYAVFKQLYGDAVTVFLKKKGLERAQGLYQEAADLGLKGSNAWSIQGARMRAEIYGALGIGILSSEEWTRLDEAADYAEKSLEAARYLFDQSRTVESGLVLISALDVLSRMYLLKKEEPRKGILAEYLYEAHQLIIYLGKKHQDDPGSGLINNMIENITLMGIYSLLVGDLEGAKMFTDAKKAQPRYVKGIMVLLRKAWKKQGILLKQMPDPFDEEEEIDN